MIRVHEHRDRDLGCGVKQCAGAGSKDTGASSTDVSASWHDEDGDTEMGSRRRKIAGRVKERRREQGLAERP